MLVTLNVRDIVLVEAAQLEFSRGLNVITGETGAGKSILLDALGLAAGHRGSGRSAVRPGAEQGSAAAVFEPAARHAARKLLRDNAMAAENEIILRRVVSTDGRTRAFINDAPVGVGLLRDVGESLIEIHGQADDRGLFDPATHRTLLDAFGGHEELAVEVAGLHAVLMQARVELETLRREAAVANADSEYLRDSIDELTVLDPKEGEEAECASARTLLVNATRIAEDLTASIELLAGERGASTAMAQVLKRLARMNEDARKAAASGETALEQAYALNEEARRELEVLLSKLDANPGTLEKTDNRLHALRSAARKYSITPDGLPRLLRGFEARLEAIDADGDQLTAAGQTVAQRQADYLAAARLLSAAREKAARALERAVQKELVPLKLGHAAFHVALEGLAAKDGGPNGLERVALEIATVQGAPFGPLTKIASGGELARFSLALKVALAAASPPAALVFDEVDRGVGGAVADAVGERLQRLAARTQVLLVTHSPQVAARADRHFRIVRLNERTCIALLSEDERTEEIARMLAGAKVTAEARAAARKLLDGARPQRPARRRA